MAYNYLREAESIRNDDSCFYDSSSAYEVDWNENGDVDGWDTYQLVHTYGVWENVLFGTSYGGNCYFSRTAYFSPVEAEDYYIINIQMKIAATRDGSHITSGKIQWLRDGDTLWDDDKSLEFDVTADNKWRYYSINMGPAQWWQGNIRNLRIYPFLNSREGDRFFVRSITINSPTEFKCTNPTCSYYSNYEHPCPGVGSKGACLGTSFTSVDIVKDVNDELIVNIDDYGDQTLKLKAGNGLSYNELAREIEQQLTKVDIGGYTTATAARDADRIIIYSGTYASDSSVVVKHSQLAEDLGFFLGLTDVSTKTVGADPATGFDFKATFRLRGVELQKLTNSDTDEIAFYHDPSRYEVEAGRTDWQETVYGLVEQDVDHDWEEYFTSFEGDGTTIIDFTHPFNSDGRITKVIVMGYPPEDETAKLKIFRPKMDGSIDLVYETSFGAENPSYVYSNYKEAFEIDLDVRVRKGDLVGFYNMNLYLGEVISDEPDALLFYISGDATGSFTPGELQAYGSFGLNFYARGDRRQNIAIIDIDLGDRVNAKSLLFYGEEITEDFEYNLAICEDRNWAVNLFDGTHTHAVDDSIVPENSYIATHENRAYGTALLGDGITYSPGGLAGTSYGMSGVHGFYTSGETYFYVNGDAEWLNQTPGENFGTPRYTAAYPTDFVHDPIQFKITFPTEHTIVRSVVYFKERRNFRNFGWAYYLGDNTYLGNYTRDLRFKWIQDYTAVTVDANRWTPETVPEEFSGYLFENPTDGTWSYNGDGTLSESSYDVIGAASLEWNLLEHEFEVTTKGIIFYTDYHVSTKLFEIEIYSSVANAPSLLDDAIVQYSREGDRWDTAVFDDITIDGQDLTQALIQDNPRYIKLELRSSSVIKYKEFELVLEGDNVFIGDTRCQDELQMITTRRGQANAAQSIDIWNEFEVPATLLVDIPTEDTVDKVVLWSKLNSAEDVTNPDIGPGGYFYKNPDYEIKNDDYQVAINNQCWALKNLILDKEVYYQYHDFGWIDWGTYAEGDNIEVAHPNKRQTKFNFTPVTAKYFKFIPRNFALFGVSEIRASFNSTDLDIYAYHTSSLDPITVFGSAINTLTDTDPTTGSYTFADEIVMIDSFEVDGLNSSLWRAASGGSYIAVNGGELKSAFDAAGETFYLDTAGKWYFPYTRRFNFVMDGYQSDWQTPTGTDYHDFRFEVWGVEGYAGAGTGDDRYVKVGRSMNSTKHCLSYWYQRDNGSGGGNETVCTGAFQTSWTDLIFAIQSPYQDGVRSRIYYPGYGWHVHTEGTMLSEDTGWFPRIYFHASSQTPGSVMPKVNFTRAYILNDSDWLAPGTFGSLGIGFDIADAIDSIRFLHDADSLTPLIYGTSEIIDVTSEWSVDVYVSYDNITYSYWDTATIEYNNYNQEIDTYVTVDLENRHALEYIRTYGPSATDYDIGSNTIYFNDETDDVTVIYPTGEIPTTEIDDFSSGLSNWTNIVNAISTGSAARLFTFSDSSGSSMRWYQSIEGDLTAKVDFNYIVTSTAWSYEIGIKVLDASNTNKQLRFVKGHISFLGDVRYCYYFAYTNDGGSNWYQISRINSADTSGKLKLVKSGVNFKAYYWNGSSWTLLGSYYYYGFSDFTYVELYTSNWNNDPEITVDFDNFELEHLLFAPATGSINDCRWPVVIIPYGEAIGRMGIYPNTSIYLAPGGGYNCEWEDLGTTLTDYAYKTNVTSAATIDASSEFGYFKAGFVIDGVIPDGEIEKCWGSAAETTPYLQIDLGAEYDIDEIRCYWGYYTANDDWLTTDYEIWSTNSNLFDIFTGDDGDSPSSKWTNVTQAEIENNSLKIWSTTSSNGSVELSSTISENFVAFVTYSGTFPNTHDYSTILRITNSDTGYMIQVSRRYDNFTHFYLMQYYDGSTWYTVGSSVTTSDTSGKLKLKREGTVVYGYYWNDGWTEFGTSTQVGNADVKVQLMQERWAFYPETVSYFDDFYVYTERIVDAVSNSEHDVIHSLDEIHTVQYLLVDISGYDAGSILIETGDGTFENFEGVFCREIEFYETKGIYYVDNEEYPIVAVDLGYKFYINSHDMTTPFEDYPDSLWDNSNSKFKYSDELEDEPEKITFTSYGVSLPRYARWILAKDTDFVSRGDVTWATDFHEYTLYSPPDDWYAHNPPGPYTWEITDELDNPLPASDRVMKVDTNADDFRFIWTDIPLTQDIELLGLMYAPSGYSGHLVARGSSTWNLGEQRGWMAYFDGNKIKIERALDGSYVSTTFAFTFDSPNDWYWLRFKLSGSNQYVKGWVYGTTEPGSWTGTWSQADLNQSGWAGLMNYGYSGSPYYFGYFSAGIAGYSAPHPDDAEVDEIEQAVTGGVNYLDNIKVNSANKYRITRFPWWWQASYSTMSANYTYIRPDSTSSVQIDYTGGPTTSGIDEIIFIEGTSLGTDTRFSEMDYLSFWLYVPDPTKLDEYGEVYFGDYSEPRYHSWNISTTVSGLFVGWNNVLLKFRDADNKISNAGDEQYSSTYYAYDNYEDLELKSFRLKLRGKGDPFTVYLDDIRIERNTFHDDVKFGKGLYLCNDEYAVWPLAEFDPHKGTLEFWMRPDFNFYGIDSFFRARTRTIFAFTNVTNDIFGLFFRQGQGLSLVVGSSEDMTVEYALPTVHTEFLRNEIVHIGFVWSNDGSAMGPAGITAAIFINGWWIAYSTETWEIRDKKSTRLMIGGAVPQVVSLQAPTSAWASIDNLKVYNYCKTNFLDKEIETPEFSELYSPNEFIEISSDGTNFYDRESGDLPLTFEQVSVGEKRTIWVRTNIPKVLTGKEKRTASLKIEWLRSF